MKKEDAKYYAEQFNAFTPCRATCSEGKLKVDGKVVRTQEQAERLYYQERKKEDSRIRWREEEDDD
jgi:hypothetical protein